MKGSRCDECKAVTLVLRAARRLDDSKGENDLGKLQPELKQVLEHVSSGRTRE